MRIDQRLASARSAARMASVAALRADSACIFAPMILPPQMTSRFLVLMVGDYSGPCGHWQCRVVNRYVGNLPPMPGVFPDYPAPVIRNADTERELTMMRWGMPPPKVGGPPVTNIRNTSSPRWRGWLKPEIAVWCAGQQLRRMRTGAQPGALGIRY
jgi:hypothetical protein